MWTLTFRENVTSYDEATRLYNAFLRRLKREFPKGKFPLLSVREIQEKRAASTGMRVWHFHIAVKRHVKHDVLTKLWGLGHVHLSFRRTKSARVGAEKVASYIAKYVGKDAGQDRPAGKHRYSCARGMSVPFQEHLLEPGDVVGFQELLEVGGFRVAGEPFPVERDGVFLGLWWSSRRVAGGSGAGRAAVAARPTGRGATATASHLKYRQITPVPSAGSP
jgi:hypothetical protein